VATSPYADLRSLATTCRRRLVRHRRVIAALLAAAAVFVGLRSVTPAPPPATLAVVAARDLSAGLRLTADDLRTVRVARSLMPTSGALTEAAAIGRVLVAPMRAGQVITDRSIVGRSLLAGYRASTVATAIRLPDADVAGLLRPGDHVDVYASVAEVGQPAALVAADVTVITVPEPADDSRQPGAAVLLAATPDQAARLAGAAGTAALSVDIRPG
jgi:Flp pilus assembly protein CpaB